MTIRSLRLLPVLAAATLVFASCGGDDDDSTDDLIDAPDGPGDAMRAPTPIRVAGGGDATVAATAEDAATSDMIAPWTPEFVVADDLPALPTDDTGWVFDAATELTAEQVQQLADSLGVAGDLVRVDEGIAPAWKVGPDDGSAPALWVSGDGQQSWNYSGPWAREGDVAACTVGIDSEGNEFGECPEPEPPTGVPSAEEAEQRARELLASIGVDADGLELETYADEWFASVDASDTVDPRGAVRSWNFGFGAEGVLQYAGGVLATPEQVGPYPLVDLDTALARLREGGFWYGGIGGPAVDLPAIAVAGSEPVQAEPVEPDVGADETRVDIAEGAVEPGDPGANGETVTVVESRPDATTEEPIEEPIEEPMPVEPLPGEAPEPVVVTLVDVQADLWWAWDVDGSSWLLPAYRFVDADGGWHTVPAVTDEFLIQTAPPVPDPMPLPEQPLPVEPDGGIGDGAQPLPALDELGALVGLPLDVFTTEAEAFGYEVRVVERDGEAFDVEADFREFRVNVVVLTVDGVEQVVRASTDDGTVIGEVTIEPVVDVPEPIVEPPGAVGPEILVELSDALPLPLDEFSERAASVGYRVRVVMIDGEPQAVTADYSETRINVAIEGDDVVAIDGIG